MNEMSGSNKEKVLELLQGENEYISGQEICEKLNISRTAVWKHINLLKEEGYVIEAVRNRGYRVVMNTTQITKGGVLLGLKTETIGRNLLVYEEIDSTNNQAKKMAEDGAKDGTLLVSDSQTAGKGRRGRVWTSPKGSSIYMTLLIRPNFNPQQASMLTLVAAMAVRKAIESTAKVQTQIKWPNDLVCNGKKVCGILTEMSAEPDFINYVVIGIGINVNMTDFPEEIRNTATSLKIEKQESVDRNRIIAEFCNWFEKYYEIFQKKNNLEDLVDEYNRHLVNRGRMVRIIEPKGDYEALSDGINENGELIVKREDGTIEQIMSGEVSVRGVYGYV